MDPAVKKEAEFERQMDEAAANWMEAQSLSFAVDLIPASLRLRQFLATVLVDRHHRCLYAGAAVSCAIQRYECCWLLLLAEHQDEAIIPPLDCAWIRYCHRLNPLAYARDCKLLHGRLLYASTTANILPTAGTRHHSRIQYDLRGAVKRQSSFYYQISAAHMGDERFLRDAEQRYKGFLHLLKMTDSKVFLVPTFDIDLMWHAHQLHPQAYSKDMEALLGRVLDHDDTDSDRSPYQKLEEGFRRTCRLWFESYGKVYERAGAMYRGEPYASEPIIDWLRATSTQSTSYGMPEDFDSYATSNSTHTCTADVAEGILSDMYTAPLAVRDREVMQVYLAIAGARIIRLKQSGIFRVRLRMLKKCDALNLYTPYASVSSSPLYHSVCWWRQAWPFQAETSTEGICLELQFKPSSLVQRMVGDTKMDLGRVKIPWKSVWESPTLSLDGWFRADHEDPTPLLAEIYLFLSVSLTPPVAGARLFRTINSIPTDDTGKMYVEGYCSSPARKGCWLTRTVLDHANREVFTMRVSYSNGQTLQHYKRTPENEKRILIHRGGWVDLGRGMEAGADIVATAEQIVNGHVFEARQSLWNERQWGFFRNTSRLIVRRDLTESTDCIAVPLLELSGRLGNDVSLVSGRKLEYEVKRERAKDEHGFVTVVRYDGDGGARASGLFNWKTGTMEVSRDESPVLVLLLSAIVWASVFDMEGFQMRLSFGATAPYPLETARTALAGGEWGAVTLQGFKKDEGSRKREITPYSRWWEMGGTEWAEAFYGNRKLNHHVLLGGGERMRTWSRRKWRRLHMT